MGRVVFLVAKISKVDFVAGAKFIYLDNVNDLSEMQLHDWAWAVAIKEFPHFFHPTNQEKTTTLKGHSLFSQSICSRTDENGVDSFTVLYKWEGKYRF